MMTLQPEYEKRLKYTTSVSNLSFVTADGLGVRIMQFYGLSIFFMQFSSLGSLLVVE